jgi:hypothetical protein
VAKFQAHMILEAKYFRGVVLCMKEKSIESLLAELKIQRNECIEMDLEDNSEAEQRLASAKLESLEGELLFTVARHVIEIEKDIATMKSSGELPKDKGTYFVGE